MKIQPNPLPFRNIWITALVLAMMGGVMSASPVTGGETSAVAISTAPVRPRTVLPARALPFSMEDFVSFVSETFHIQPTEIEPDYAKFIYSERQSGGRDVEIMRIMIQSREAHLQVAFSFREFNVMHYVAEFMEGPFFTRTESEQLYALLYEPAGPAGWKQVGRFQARITFVNGSEGMDALFEFTGLGSGGQR